MVAALALPTAKRFRPTKAWFRRRTWAALRPARRPAAHAQPFGERCLAAAGGLNEASRADPSNTPSRWAQKQILDATNKRIQGLTTAAATRTTPAGSTEIPSISDIRGFRKLQFRIDADTPALRTAVAAAIASPAPRTRAGRSPPSSARTSSCPRSPA